MRFRKPPRRTAPSTPTKYSSNASPRSRPAPKESMSNHRNRVAALETDAGDDPASFRCLERFDLWKEHVHERQEQWQPHLDLDDPPPLLPTLPFSGVCPRVGGREPVCAECIDRAQVYWTRRRALTLTFRGIAETDLGETGPRPSGLGK